MGTFAHFLSQYGYFGLFGLLMVGIIGLPVPEETLLTFAGVLVYRGHLELVPTLLAAFFGSACGITVSYGLGRVVTRRLGRFVRIAPEQMDRVEAWFERVGHWGLLWGYFLPGIRHLTAVAAGATRLRFVDFAVFAYTGALMWSLTFVSLGALAGRHWMQVYGQVHENLKIASGVVLLIMIAALAARRLLMRRG